MMNAAQVRQHPGRYPPNYATRSAGFPMSTADPTHASPLDARLLTVAELIRASGGLFADTAADLIERTVHDHRHDLCLRCRHDDAPGLCVDQLNAYTLAIDWLLDRVPRP